MAVNVAVCGAKITCNGTKPPDIKGTVTGTTDNQAAGCNDSILTESDIVKGANLENFVSECTFQPHPIGGGRFLPCSMVPSGGWENTSKGFGDTS